MVILRFKRFLYDWMPRRLFIFLRWHIRIYLGWEKLSPLVENWVFCWLANAFKPFALLSAQNFGLVLKNQREKLVTVRYRSGLRVMSYPSSIGTMIESQEYLDRFFLAAKFQPGDIAIDIGAHIGSVSLPLAFMGFKVYSYEPNPDNFQVLTLNREENRLHNNLSVFPLAVSDSIGTAIFELGGSSALGSLSGVRFSMRKKNTERIKIRTTTLADIFADHSIGQVKLLKIDCEGSEYAILFADGAAEILRRCYFLIMEVHPVEVEGWNKYQLYHHLTDCGFQIQVFENPGNGCADFYCKNTRLTAVGGASVEAALAALPREST